MNDERKEWTIYFDQNGGEYTGYVSIKAKSVKQTGPKSFSVDDADVELDENITSIVAPP